MTETKTDQTGGLDTSKIKLLPKQEKFVNLVLLSLVYKFFWFVGGFGVGKSFIGCYLSILLSHIYPNNRGFIGRSTLVDLKATTLKTFFEVCGLLGLEENVHYKYIKSPTPVVIFNNGSEILFNGLDDEERVKGMELGFFYLDEVDEVKESIFIILQGRLRKKTDAVDEQGLPINIRRVGFITSNSAGRNWTYNVFIKKEKLGHGMDEEEKSKYLTMRASSFENPHLPDDYIATLKGYEPNLFNRFVLGEFTVFEGMIFPEFDEKIHIRDNVIGLVDQERFLLTYSLDHGLTNPTAILEGWTDEFGNIYITWEHYVPGEPIKTHAQSLKGRWTAIQRTSVPVVADPSTFAKTQQPTPEKPYPFSIADEYQEYGVTFIPANNDVMAGITRVKGFFKERKIIIDRKCEMLIKEIYSYKWKTDRDKDHIDAPVKKFDHAMDALRYMIMSKPFGKKQEKVYDDGLAGIIQKDIETLNKIDTMNTNGNYDLFT